MRAGDLAALRIIDFDPVDKLLFDSLQDSHALHCVRPITIANGAVVISVRTNHRDRLYSFRKWQDVLIVFEQHDALTRRAQRYPLMLRRVDDALARIRLCYVRIIENHEY